MDNWTLFLKGTGLGISIAAPVGPIGVLCIQRTLKKGFSSGVASGLGAASADLLYGSLAAFGALWLGNHLVQLQTPLRLLGGGVLILLGVRAFFQKEKEATVAGSSPHLAGDYFSTFLLTLTNPITIFSFAAVYGGLGLGSAETSTWQMGLLVLGVFVGSVAWWLTLSSLVALLRGRFKPQFYKVINKIAGVVLVGFGVSLLLALLK
ncbi:MAG TPA: LysE family transporter [Anaerolineaceae bacterium]|mgnify:CR=1 FL=1|nr:LysE family transporter [Anaerolineaceae bacterium]